jgi:hypothetical protein
MPQIFVRLVRGVDTTSVCAAERCSNVGRCARQGDSELRLPAHQAVCGVLVHVQRVGDEGPLPALRLLDTACIMLKRR